MEFLHFSPYNRGLGRRKIKFKSRETIEPQEVLLDRLAQHKEVEMGISEKKLEVPLNSKILRIFYSVSVILFLVLFGVTFYLEVIRGSEYSRLSKDNSQRIIYSRLDRGVIYDSKLEQLVFNIPSFDLVLDKRDLPQDSAVSKNEVSAVANIIKINPDNLQKEIDDSKTSEILILENIPHDILVLLEAKIFELSGFRIEKNTIRSYKDGSNFAHLIGYMGKINEDELLVNENYSIADYIGKSGLEKFYEGILRGVPGKTIIEKDAMGKKMKEYTASEPVAGENLVLYLDAGLQKKSADALTQIMANVGSKAGAVIAIDPKTGGILTMVSEPSFDNNLFSRGISAKDLQTILNDPQKPFLNRIVAGGYVTGSTIKPLIGSAALQENIIGPNTTVNCKGSISVTSPYDPSVVWTFNDLHVHGITNVKKALAESCNVFFMTIGGGYGSQRGLGVDLIKKYLNLFGWGSPTNIDYPEEIAGRVPDPEWKKTYFENKEDQIWYPGDTYNLSIGQGYLSATPLQVVTAFATIANNGKLMEPHIVKEIVDNDKNVAKEIEPKVVREGFISLDNLAVIRQGMRDAVTYGSSVTLNSLPVKVAAKTGTAQTPNTNKFHNWVTVFAPYDDPQIVITIMMENVPGLQAAVLPVAKEILNYYFSK